LLDYLAWLLKILLRKGADLIVLVLIYIWVFNMLWNLNFQGWMFVIIVAGLNIIFSIASVLGGSSWQALAVSVLVNGVIILYCFMPGVKDAFQIA